MISAHDAANILNTVASNLPAIITSVAGFLYTWRKGRQRDVKLDDIHNIVNGNTDKLLKKIPDAVQEPRGDNPQTRTGDAPTGATMQP